MIPPPRKGERVLAADPASQAGDARLVFIGHVAAPFKDLAGTPKNPNAARQDLIRLDSETGGVSVQIDRPFRPGLTGLSSYSHVIVLVWLDQARRDLIQVQPSHLPAPSGVFALRSPVRPNPIGLSVARIVSIDAEAGVVVLDALDFKDGTPVIDIKPYRPAIDARPDAVVP